MKNAMKALALLLLVVIAVPAAAQSLTGVITGTVKDEQGGEVLEYALIAGLIRIEPVPPSRNSAAANGLSSVRLAIIQRGAWTRGVFLR